MGTFANEQVLYINNPSPSTAEGLQMMRSNQVAIKELEGASAPVTITIADGAITPTSSYLRVDTEGQAAADDLQVINVVTSDTNTLHDGMVVYLQAADSARVVTVKDTASANGIRTASGSDIVLDTVVWHKFQLRSGVWYEVVSLQTQTIDGVKIDGRDNVTHSAVCSTAAATAAKTVTLDGFVLTTGAEITVKFTNGNTATAPTLNVNSTGAIAIVYQGSAIAETAIAANTVCRFYYDGTSWNAVGIVPPIATTSVAGIVKPDGSSIVINDNGVISSTDSVPVGTIIWSANATVPAGYLLCNGSAVGRATYPELFAAIGTAFGSGDGSTTFNLPNLINKFIEGGNSAGTVKAAGLPNITGQIGTTRKADATGAFVWGDRVSYNYSSSTESRTSYYLTFDASLSNDIYGNSNTVQPPAVTALPCIKAFSSVVGDAQIIATQLANDINSKVALDGSNLSGATVKTVVETWHSGTEWYRVWSDGWIEQGGRLPLSTGGNYIAGTITFNKPFTTTNYNTFIMDSYTSNNAGYASWTNTRTTTGVAYGGVLSTSGADWMACGY